MDNILFSVYSLIQIKDKEFFNGKNNVNSILKIINNNYSWTNSY